MNNPLVSVIIPAYNRAEIIGATLRSIASQTYINWECLVVDDGSTDNTKEQVTTYVNNDQRFKLFERPEKHIPGGSGARNYGISKAEGKYIMFIDSDDILDASCLLNRVQNFESAPQFDFLVFRTWYFLNEPGDCQEKVGQKPDQIEDSLSEFLKYNLPWDTRGPIWKKSALEDLGGFDEELLRLQDVDLHTRALKEGNKFRFYDDADTFYRGMTTEPKPNPVYFKEKVLPAFLRYYRKTFKDLNKIYLEDLQQGIMVTFKKYFLAYAVLEPKSLYAYLSDLHAQGMISTKQKNVLNSLTFGYAFKLNAVLGSKNLIRVANKTYYH